MTVVGGDAFRIVCATGKARASTGGPGAGERRAGRACRLGARARSPCRSVAGWGGAGRRYGLFGLDRACVTDRPPPRRRRSSRCAAVGGVGVPRRVPSRARAARRAGAARELAPRWSVDRALLSRRALPRARRGAIAAVSWLTEDDLPPMTPLVGAAARRATTTRGVSSCRRPAGRGGAGGARAAGIPASDAGRQVACVRRALARPRCAGARRADVPPT